MVTRAAVPLTLALDQATELGALEEHTMTGGALMHGHAADGALGEFGGAPWTGHRL
ncbi:hypothetical protein NOCA270058 [metagenome]|uniref:Uncharacterized protein n=1 Tax=metagenome TaxID=256318 RepID=A0A2P2CDM0_9ZZZZ